VTQCWGWPGAQCRNQWPYNGNRSAFLYGADGQSYPVSAENGNSVVTFPDCTQFRVIEGGQLFRIANPPPLAPGCSGVQTVPTITWANPAAILKGTALSATQLNATASVPGTLLYTPAAGTVMNIVGAAQQLRVDFTPADAVRYTTASKTVTIDVVDAAAGFDGPTQGGGWVGQLQDGNLIYNGVSYPVINAVVTFPDCSTYWVAPNGMLFVGAPPAVGCVPVGGPPPSGFQGPPQTGVWVGQANQAGTLFNYMGTDYAMVNGVVTFPDNTRYAIVAGKYMYRL
jgi:hypothetical protein